MNQLTSRQQEIVRIVQENAPITGEHIAELLGVSRPTLRSDLAILVMLGFVDAKPKVGYFLGRAFRSPHLSDERLRRIKVKDIQSLPVVIRDRATVNDAVATLFLENVGTLIVTDDHGALMGIVSRKDLLKVMLGNAGILSMPISLAMTRANIITVTPEDDLVEAARKMIQHEVDSLPVIIPHSNPDSAGKYEVTGRVTKTTMTRILLDYLAKG
jgi:DeoR family transcriptional regulator, catabolite repression regulator